MNSSNSSEDWYQTAIKKFKINEIPYKKFSGKPTRIGRGGFGLIYKTECDSIGTVAIKEITISIEDDEICIKNFINELKIHSRIEHERIIQFYGISRNIDEGLYYLVLEYANQGNLRTPMEYKHIYTSCWETKPNSRPLIEEVLSRLSSMSLNPVFEDDDKVSTIVINLFQYPDTSRNSTSELKNIIICCYGFTQDPTTKSYYIVLKYASELLHNIHKTNYVHGNLNSRSILLQEDDLNHKLEIYISDLDLCIYSNYKAKREFYDVLTKLTVYAAATAPEILRGEIISIKSDIYSLGVIMRELISGGYTPQCYHELMQKCLDDEPEKRPDTLDLLEELHIFTASPLRKRQFEDADSRGLQINPPLQISPLLQISPPLQINTPS
ncbi:9234_t:CDS:2 [Rhizophagus irregularis]|nr:9234_t:CDS:2 [Rhizophagus irregularis]